MTTRFLDPFPTPTDNYDRDNESQFRRQLAQQIQDIRNSIVGVQGTSEFFNVRDYGRSTTTEWDTAFSAADDAAVAAGGVVLVPPGTYALADDFEFVASVMFAGGVIKPANTKTLTVGAAADITALAGEWFDSSDGGTVVRPGVAHKEDGLDLDGDLTANGSILLALASKFYPGAESGTYIWTPSTNLIEIIVEDDSGMQFDHGLITVFLGTDFKFGRNAAAAVAVASTHKIQVLDANGDTYYLLATT